MLDPGSPFFVRPSLDPAMLRWLAVFLASSRRSRYAAAAPALVELCRWSVEEWERLSGPGERGFGMHRRGLLVVLESERSLSRALRDAEYTQTLGVPWEYWSIDRIREKEPIITGRIAGGVYFPADAHCEPDRAVVRLGTEARSIGVCIIENTPVIGARCERGVVRALLLESGEVEADHFVLAAGFWAGDLGRAMGLQIPMRAGKGYSLQYPRGGIHPSRSIYLADRRITVTPHDHALRLAGTLEVVGDDLSLNARRIGAIVRGAHAVLDLDVPRPVPEAWAGLRPCLAHGMPVIGRSPGHQNLWLATGHQMTGLKCAPGTARLIADLMEGRTPLFDPGPFDPANICRMI